MLQGRNSNNYQERAEAIVELSTGSIFVGNFVWDVDTLSWIKMTASSSTGATGVGSSGGGDYAEITLVAAPYVYEAKAVPGTSTSASSWQVKRTDTTGPIVVTWADGNQKFDNVASNLASLSYS